MKEKFDISRLHTPFAIISVQGELYDGLINISQLKLLSTDGWVLLDLSTQFSVELMHKVKPEIAVFLKARSC